MRRAGCSGLVTGFSISANVGYVLGCHSGATDLGDPEIGI
jgi:hypothetical protein